MRTGGHTRPGRGMTTNPNNLPREFVMSHNTTTPRHLRVVTNSDPDPAALTAEDKVRAALAANPGTRTGALAKIAGVGRSTAAKILVAWDRDGTAVRTPGDSPQNPDTWTLAPAPDDNTHAAPPVPGDTASSATSTAGASDAPAHVSGRDNTPRDDADTGAPAAATSTPVGADVTGSTDTATPASGATSATPAPSTAPRPRLAKGGLRALVAAYLADHPGESFGPARIGTDLQRSGGAVNNALEKLTAEGYAVKTCLAPKRFALNPGHVGERSATEESE
ncbi:hypothetical protein LY15_003110 [Prauserella flava]|nr:hypothetical protein [Prauserella flava]MCR3734797.1 hypothetical protein [Prauserella salsuginis]